MEYLNLNFKIFHLFHTNLYEKYFNLFSICLNLPSASGLTNTENQVK